MVVVVARSDAYFSILERSLTVDRVHEFFGPLVRGGITRYVVPQILALNFVMEGTLGGGVTRSTRLDPHGKTRAFYLLSMELEVDAGAVPSNGVG